VEVEPLETQLLSLAIKPSMFIQRLGVLLVKLADLGLSAMLVNERSTVNISIPRRKLSEVPLERASICLERAPCADLRLEAVRRLREEERYRTATLCVRE
jgi:hypothetical protein